MKIYLICAPVWNTDRIPLGLATLQAYLKDAGHDVRIFDLSNQVYRESKIRFLVMNICENYSYINRKSSYSYLFLGKTIDYFSNVITADVYCFSIYRTNIQNSLLIAERIKKENKKARIVFGGPYTYFSFARRRIEESGVVDYIIQGEGELDLIAYLNNPDEIPPFQEHKMLKNLDKELLPDFSGLDLTSYFGELPYSTSRGCHNPCTYCFDRLYWVKYRYKSAKKIYQDLRALNETYGIRLFLFSDSTCFGTKDNLLEFCRLVVDNDFKIYWGSQTRYFDFSDKELHLVRQSGCTWLSIGVESCSPKVLRHMRKGYNIGKIERFIRKAYNLSIKVSTCYMVGYPNEKWKDFFMTLKFILKNRKYVNIAVPSTTSIYEGTHLYKNAEVMGIKNKDSFFWRSKRSNAFNRLLKYFILKSVNHLFVRKKKRWLRKPIT